MTDCRPARTAASRSSVADHGSTEFPDSGTILSACDQQGIFSTCFATAFLQTSCKVQIPWCIAKYSNKVAGLRDEVRLVFRDLVSKIDRNPPLESFMRLPILDPSGLSDEQKPLYKDMRAGIESHFRGFVNTRPDGALLGPSGIPGQANRISVSRFGNWLRQWFPIRRCQRRCARSQSWLRDLTFVRAARAICARPGR